MTESVKFQQAENAVDKDSVVSEGQRTSARVREGVTRPSHFNNGGLTGKYSHSLQFLMKKEQSRKRENMSNYMKTTVDVVFTQTSVKKGIILSWTKSSSGDDKRAHTTR